MKVLPSRTPAALHDLLIRITHAINTVEELSHTRAVPLNDHIRREVADAVSPLCDALREVTIAYSRALANPPT